MRRNQRYNVCTSAEGKRKSRLFSAFFSSPDNDEESSIFIKSSVLGEVEPPISSLTPSSEASQRRFAFSPFSSALRFLSSQNAADIPTVQIIVTRFIRCPSSSTIPPSNICSFHVAENFYSYTSLTDKRLFLMIFSILNNYTTYMLV